MNNCAIIGSGFKSIYLALKLRKVYPAMPISICAERLGGIYSSIEKEGFQLDIGCHLFDLTNENFVKTFEIEENQIIPIDLKYASINNFGLTENYAVYDFRNNPDYKLIRDEFLSKKRNNNKAITLYDWSINRYGNKITKVLDNICFKITGKSCKVIDYRSEGMFLFKRILLFDNDKTLSLKKDEIYGKLLAAQSKSIHDYSKKYIIFTFEKGNFGFVKHIKKVLKNKNIEITKDIPNNYFSINLNKGIKNLEKLSTPLHLVYLKCERFPYTYLHDYSENQIFRVSSPGIYSKQFINNKSYICLEIPDPKLRYDKNEIIELAKTYISNFNKINSELLHYIFVPTSYPVYQKFSKDLNNNDLNPFCYSKDEIMNNIDNFVEKFNF